MSCPQSNCVVVKNTSSKFMIWAAAYCTDTTWNGGLLACNPVPAGATVTLYLYGACGTPPYSVFISTDPIVETLSSSLQANLSNYSNAVNVTAIGNLMQKIWGGDGNMTTMYILNDSSNSVYEIQVSIDCHPACLSQPDIIPLPAILPACPTAFTSDQSNCCIVQNTGTVVPLYVAVYESQSGTSWWYSGFIYPGCSVFIPIRGYTFLICTDPITYTCYDTLNAAVVSLNGAAWPNGILLGAKTGAISTITMPNGSKATLTGSITAADSSGDNHTTMVTAAVTGGTTTPAKVKLSKSTLMIIGVIALIVFGGLGLVFLLALYKRSKDKSAPPAPPNLPPGFSFAQPPLPPRYPRYDEGYDGGTSASWNSRRRFQNY